MGECICIVRIKSDVSQLAILEMLIVRFSIIVRIYIYIYILATRIIIIYNYMYTINVLLCSDDSVKCYVSNLPVDYTYTFYIKLIDI